MLPSLAAAHAYAHPLSLTPAPQAVDQVFTFERWNKHRNSYRYAKHLAHMFSSRVFRQLLGPVLAVMALALFVGVYETLVNVSRGRAGHVCNTLAGSLLPDQLPLLQRVCIRGQLGVDEERAGRGIRPSAGSLGLHKEYGGRGCPCWGCAVATLSLRHPMPAPAAAPCPQRGALPGHWPHVTLALGQGFNLTAFALSLLLVRLPVLAEGEGGRCTAGAVSLYRRAEHKLYHTYTGVHCMPEGGASWGPDHPLDPLSTPGVPHQLVLRPLVGGAQAVGRRRQPLPRHSAAGARVVVTGQGAAWARSRDC